MNKIKSWSYSQLSDYQMCPHAWMYRRLVKLPEPPNYYMAKGNAAHKIAEEFLLGNLAYIPSVLGKFKNEFEKLKDNSAKPEEAFVLTQDWKHIPDGWMHDNAWLRLKLDARVNNYVVDFKTGKQYPEHIKQGKLYANVMMMLYPEYDNIDVEFWYLNSGEVTSFEFSRKELENDIKEWERQVAIMHSDTEFKPTPHRYCSNCYVKHLCSAYE